MRSVNKVIIVGNLTRDPAVKQTQNGQTLTTFSVATNREWITKGGDHKNSAEYHDCVAWSRLGEICHKYLKKGKLVYIEGYLKTRSWEGNDGQKKYKTEIVVQDMIMLNKRSEFEEDYIPDLDEDTTYDDLGGIAEGGFGNKGDSDDSGDDGDDDKKEEEKSEDNVF